jgi:hypothetical protein
LGRSPNPSEVTVRRIGLASLALVAATAVTPAHAGGPLPPHAYCTKSACVLLGLETDGSSVTVTFSCWGGTWTCVYLHKTIP